MNEGRIAVKQGVKRLRPEIASKRAHDIGSRISGVLPKPLSTHKKHEAAERLSCGEWFLRYWHTLRHVPPRALWLRLRREAISRYLARRRLIGRMKRVPGKLHNQVVARLLDADFLSAARRSRVLVSSAFELDQNAGRLIFRKTGRVLDDEFIVHANWNEPALIPPSDSDACYFAAFAEQALLVDLGHANSSLDYVARYLDLLERHTLPNHSFLTIAWRPYTMARRLSNVLLVLSLLLEADFAITINPNFGRVIAACRYLHRLLDMLREDDLGFNHLATETFVQAIAAHVFEGGEARERRVTEFLNIVRRQVGSDGLQFERSGTYQTQILSHMDVLLAANAFPSEALGEAKQLLERMRFALGVLTHPDGEMALFNDCGIGIDPSPQVLGVPVSTRRNGLESLKEAGFHRLNGGSFSVICDIGNCGPDEMPGHSHADYLSIEASHDRQRFISDPGVATSKAGPGRTWTRSSQVHNGPTFRSLEPMDFWSAFRVGRRGYAHHVRAPQLDSYAPISVAGWHSGFDHVGGRVARWIGVWPDEMIAHVDIWLGCDNHQAHSSFLIWHALHCRARQDGFEIVREKVPFLKAGAVIGSFTLGTEQQFPFGTGIPKEAACLVGEPSQDEGFRALATVWHAPEVQPDLLFNSNQARGLAATLFSQVKSRDHI
jgi:hypothetical protein